MLHDIFTHFSNMMIDFDNNRFHSMHNHADTARKDIIKYFKEIKEDFMLYNRFELKSTIKSLSMLKNHLLDIFCFVEEQNLKVLNFNSQHTFEYIDSLKITLRKRMFSLRPVNKKNTKKTIMGRFEVYETLEWYS